jgi:hypothetical protein
MSPVPAARLTAAAARPTPSIAKLFSPANASTTATARNASAKLSRAIQRCEGVPSGLMPEYPQTGQT